MEVYNKICRYCAFQERTIREVKEKLLGYGIPPQTADSIIATLVDEGIVDEQRFATQYARGKFRINKWGQVKIAAELSRKRISRTIIISALDEIDNDEYLATLEKLAEKKWNSLRNEPPQSRRLKTIHYLVQKGFEKNRAMVAADKAGAQNQT